MHLQKEGAKLRSADRSLVRNQGKMVSVVFSAQLWRTDFYGVLTRTQARVLFCGRWKCVSASFSLKLQDLEYFEFRHSSNTALEFGWMLMWIFKIPVFLDALNPKKLSQSHLYFQCQLFFSQKKTWNFLEIL